jgi:hypothetical protein
VEAAARGEYETRAINGGTKKYIERERLAHTHTHTDTAPLTSRSIPGLAEVKATPL